MKIVVYAGSGGSGGLKGYIKGFLSSCDVDSSVEIVVICTQQLYDYVHNKSSNNVRYVISDKCNMKLKSYLMGNKLNIEIIQIIASEKPDIVYFMNSIIHRGTENYINVVGMHNQLYIDNAQLRRQKCGKELLSLYIQRYYARRSMRMANAVVFDSKHSMNQCIEEHVSFKKGIVAYFGVEEDERNDKLLRKDINSPVDLLYVATIFPYKNQLALLDGIALLKDRGYLLKLHLVGSGPEKYTNELKKKIQALDLNNEVVLYSWLDHSKVKNMIDDTDIFIYASSIETSGFGLMEGMVRGAVIMCNNESCMPEILGDGGMLFDVHNAQNTADILEKLIINQDLRTSLSAKALEYSKRYTWKNHVMDIFSNLKDLLD